MRKLILFLACFCYGLSPIFGQAKQAPNAQQFITNFYKAYVQACEKTPQAEQAVLSAYVSPQLRRKIKTMQLDFDPLLNAQDVTENLLKTRKIKALESKNSFEVAYLDSFSGKSIKIFLQLSKINGRYQIIDCM